VTTPKVNTIKRGGARFYVSPATGEKSPGVTSILDMSPKPFLAPWNAKMVAEEAVNNLGAVVSIAMNNRQAAVDMLKGAAYRSTAHSAEVGTDAHDLFDKLANSEPIGRVAAELQPFVDHFNEFLDTCQPEYVHTERTIWSTKYDYAGTFDAFVIIDGVRYWLDNKTTKSGIHEEVGLQLAAYRYSDVLMNPDGTTTPTPEGDGGIVLHIRPEGWQLVPVDAGPESFEQFLRFRESFRWDREAKPHIVGQPVAFGPTESTLKKPVKRRVPRALKPATEVAK